MCLGTLCRHSDARLPKTLSLCSFIHVLLLKFKDKKGFFGCYATSFSTVQYRPLSPNMTQFFIPTSFKDITILELLLHLKTLFPQAAFFKMCVV